MSDRLIDYISRETPLHTCLDLEIIRFKFGPTGLFSNKKGYPYKIMIRG
jgi:hypothetical protein